MEEAGFELLVPQSRQLGGVGCFRQNTDCTARPALFPAAGAKRLENPMRTNLGTGVRASLRCALLGLPLHRADGRSWLGPVAVLRLCASASARRRVASKMPQFGIGISNQSRNCAVEATTARDRCLEV
jgi:hypothetical protein